MSARTGAGIEELVQLIALELPRPDVDVEVVVPYDRGDLVSRLHEDGEVLASRHLPAGTHIVGRVNQDLAADLAAYAVVPDPAP